MPFTPPITCITWLGALALPGAPLGDMTLSRQKAIDARQLMTTHQLAQETAQV
jgi:hypothetical protein